MLCFWLIEVDFDVAEVDSDVATAVSEDDCELGAEAEGAGAEGAGAEGAEFECAEVEGAGATITWLVVAICWP